MEGRLLILKYAQILQHLIKAAATLKLITILLGTQQLIHELNKVLVTIEKISSRKSERSFQIDESFAEGAKTSTEPHHPTRGWRKK